MPRHLRSIAARAGASALRILTAVLLAVSVALLVRPAGFLVAALGDEANDGLGPALAAVGLHLVVVGLAASLFLRSRRSPVAPG